MDGLEDFRNALRKFNLVPVVGAGVSMAAANLPSWHRLIEVGFDYAAACGGCEGDELSYARNSLASGAIPEAAQRLKTLLGAPKGQYPAWLESVFDKSLDDILENSVLNAIADLLCPLVATTNYDLLLEHKLLGYHESVTWRKPQDLLRALKKGRAVLHLHGSFLDPESVILGADNYEELVLDQAYLDVMRSLWMERTLLFIGCSFDGLQDPDFMRMLEWFQQTFPGTSHRHYALMLQDSFSTEQQRQWLHDLRVQIIPYGPDHSHLAGAIRHINMNGEKAYSLRLDLCKALLEQNQNREEDRQRFISLMEGAVRENERGNLEAAASELFSCRTQKSVQQRGDLRAMQMLVRSQVDVQAIEAEIKAWNRGKTKFVGSFRDNVRSAAGALFLFQDELLRDLKRRNVQIHGNVLNGLCRQMLESLERGAALDLPLTKPWESEDWEDYRIENAKRVLTTLVAVLDASPEQMFPDPESGSTTNALLMDNLVVVRKNGIEIRSTSAPYERLAWLPADPELQGGSIERMQGQDIVVAFSRESIFAWNPEIPTPILEFSTDQAFGINSIDCRTLGTTLHSVVATTDGSVYFLRDLIFESVRHAPPGSFISNIAILQDGKTFGLMSKGMWLVRDHAGEWREVLDPALLEEQIMKLPFLGSHYARRLKESAQYFGPLWDSGKVNSRFQHPVLRRVSVEDRDVLALSVQLSFHITDEVIILLDPDRDPLTVIGYFLKPRSGIADFTVVPTGQGRARLLCALLSDFKLGYDLVVWALGANTNGGTIFVEEGSTVRTKDDLIRIAWCSQHTSFAADDSGGLFRFSLVDRSWEEIDRQESRIAKLACAGQKAANIVTAGASDT